MKRINIYLADERYGEAIPHLQELNAQDPHDLLALAQLRHAREEEGRRSIAAVDLLWKSQSAVRSHEITQRSVWLEKNPNDFKSRLGLADLLIEHRDYVAAVTHLEILESMMPTDGRVTEKLQRVRVLLAEAGKLAPISEE